MSPAMDWVDYERLALAEWGEILTTRPAEEPVFQRFLEQHPSFLPHDAMGRRHDAWPEAIVTQPALRGFVGHQPDFLLIEEDSEAFKPVFVEIEAPAKAWGTDAGDVRAELTHAYGQLLDWQTWLTDTAQARSFRDHFELHPFDRSGFEPKFRLVYGREQDVKSDPRLRAKRKALRTRDRDVMTYDRLQPQWRFRNYVTIRRRSGAPRPNEPNFDLVGIPACFRFNSNAGELCMRVRLDEDVVRTAPFMSTVRSEEIIERWGAIGEDHRNSKSGQHYAYTRRSVPSAKFIEE